eukprot:1950558-Amphidinium_carterae.1
MASFCLIIHVSGLPRDHQWRGYHGYYGGLALSGFKAFAATGFSGDRKSCSCCLSSLPTSAMQVWIAKPLPHRQGLLIPDNTLVCSLHGGCIDLEDGDYDGDLLAFTSDADFLHLLNAASVRNLHTLLTEVETEVCTELTKKEPT